MRKRRRQRGQVVLLVLVAMGIFLFGAIALGIDGSRLYAEKQMAQAAADAAAQAAMMSIFNHTNSIGQPTDFTATRGSTWDCASLTADSRTPCVYALRNSFGARASDTVRIYFPDPAEVPGIGSLSDDPVNLVRATVSRAVDTTLMRLLGATATVVQARATAAVLTENAPVPILVTHPTLDESLKVQGNPTIRICGGPQQSIQVNSSSGTPGNPGLPAYSAGGSSDIDLSKAGPLSGGLCAAGEAPTGGDFGVTGGPSAAPPSTQGDVVNDVNLGPNGTYWQPHARIEDPLKDVPYPDPDLLPAGVRDPTTMTPGANGCPASSTRCHLYSPGKYNYIWIQNETAVFKPGIYYILGACTTGNCRGVGFGNAANGEMVMSSGFASDPVTEQGMLVYNSAPDSAGPVVFDVGANSTAVLTGTPDNSVYQGILFFQRRESLKPTPPKIHRFGGGGDVVVEGTIYITNTRENMEATEAWYQPVLLQGGPGQGTLIRGQIIVSALELGGNGTIIMQLDPTHLYTIRKVALVK